jgi:hypothetical protein
MQTEELQELTQHTEASLDSCMQAIVDVVQADAPLLSAPCSELDNVYNVHRASKTVMALLTHLQVQGKAMPLDGQCAQSGHGHGMWADTKRHERWVRRHQKNRLFQQDRCAE